MCLSAPPSIILLASFIAAVLGAPILAGTYTIIVQEGRLGYDGTRDAYMVKLNVHPGTLDPAADTS